MDITYTLPGFKQVNQLTQTENGQRDANASWDCVAASLADGLTFLTGKQYYEHDLRVAVYGQNYTGGMAAVSYVNFCAKQGVLLQPFNASPGLLVQKIHAEVNAGRPVVGTIPSLWGIPVSQQRGNWTTHVVCFAGTGPGMLRASNPWTSPQWQDNTDAYWTAELCDNQVWVMSHITNPTQQAQYPGALWIPAPSTHFWQGRAGHKLQWGIMHGTASPGQTTEQAVAAYLNSDNPPTSAHFIIGQDGVVIQQVKITDSAWCNGAVTAGHDPWWTSAIDPNYQTVSIEHVKPDVNNATALTPAQQKSSFELAAWLSAQWRIPTRAADAYGGWTGHASMDPVNRRYCPGTYPWGALWAYLQNGASQVTSIPQGWTDSANGDPSVASGVLSAPNGVKVEQGFRYTVLTQPWQADNWPITDAHAANPCNPLDPKSGPGAGQLFKYFLMVWSQTANSISTVAAGDFAQKLGNELYALQHAPAPAPAPAPAGTPPVASTPSADEANWQRVVAIVKAAEAEEAPAPAPAAEPPAATPPQPAA